MSESQLEILWLVILFIVLGSLAIFAMFNLAKLGNKIHDKLDVVREEAIKAKTYPELRTAYANLIEVNKECFHKSFTSKVYEIQGILETKLSMMSDHERYNDSK